MSSTKAAVEALIEEWLPEPASAARQKQCGRPTKARRSASSGIGTIPGKRTEVVRDEIGRIFRRRRLASSSTGSTTEFRSKDSRICAYDGLLDGTAGRGGARCDTEAANFITLNLMHEIVTGEPRRVKAVDVTAAASARE